MSKTTESANPPESISKIEIRQLSVYDLGEIERVERNTWPEEWQAPRDKFEARIKTFPQGAMGIFVDGKLVGVTTSMRFTFEPSSLSDYHRTWDQITGDGFITTHEQNGNAVYVVSVGVEKSSQGQGLGQKLVGAQLEVAKKTGCRYLVLGARLPMLKQHLSKSGVNIHDLSESQLTDQANEYLNLRRENGERLDPEIRFYERCGLIVGRLTDPNFGPDTESCNFGVIMFTEIPA